MWLHWGFAAHKGCRRLHTFSSFSVTGGGLAAVTWAAISAPMRHASALDLQEQQPLECSFTSTRIC
jgi:hypothetical protein